MAFEGNFEQVPINDVIAGADLTDRQNQEMLRSYFQKHKPFCIIGGPPCTSFSNWSRFNRTKWPETWKRSRIVGEALAQVMADAIELQMRGGRFFLMENPAGSEIFDLGCMQRLKNIAPVGSITFPQCALGLVSLEGVPLKKMTTL